MSVMFSDVDRLEAAMSFHRERHTVLAGNVANLDTPGFRPMDLERAVGPTTVPAAVTHAAHVAGPAEAAYAVSFDDGGALSNPDGNAVSLERELAKIDANRTRYATTAELTSRRLALLRYAAGDGA
ncbi:MAG: hypothetical protein R2939_03300 [Kofleriaceae bacterium]